MERRQQEPEVNAKGLPLVLGSELRHACPTVVPSCLEGRRLTAHR